MSGYDIKKQVNAALGMITNASYGTLYPTLHKQAHSSLPEGQQPPTAASST